MSRALLSLARHVARLVRPMAEQETMLQRMQEVHDCNGMFDFGALLERHEIEDDGEVMFADSWFDNRARHAERARGSAQHPKRNTHVQYAMELFRSGIAGTSLARAESFREVRDADALSHALVGLRLCNQRALISQGIDKILAPHERPPGIEYRVGSVLRHIHFNWQGVVTGYFETCPMDEDWLIQNDAQERADKPWYSIVCSDGHARLASQVTHVPLPSPKPYKNTPDGPLDVEELLDRFFLGFDSDAGRYIPSAELLNRFPD